MVPFNSMVPLFAYILFRAVIVPPTCNAALLMVRVAPVANCRLFELADELTTGLFGVPAGMKTLVEDPGIPPHQLEASCQLLPAVPSQVPVALTVTVKLRIALLPQKLEANTVTFPLLLPAVTVIVLVPCPALMTHPAGTDHIYEVAFTTGVIE